MFLGRKEKDNLFQIESPTYSSVSNSFCWLCRSCLEWPIESTYICYTDWKFIVLSPGNVARWTPSYVETVDQCSNPASVKSFRESTAMLLCILNLICLVCVLKRRNRGICSKARFLKLIEFKIFCLIFRTYGWIFRP
jgi:hypothetical protein